MRPSQAGAAPWPVDHVGVAVHDLEAGAAPWGTLGLPLAGDETVADQGVRVRLLRTGNGFLELLAPLDEASPVARFLAKRGPGLHHLAFRVDDVAGELARLVSEGAEPIDEVPRLGRAGSRVAFLHPRGWGGVLVELVQPAYRPGPP